MGRTNRRTNGGASARVAEALRQRIWQGIYPSHSHLPPVKELAHEFSASCTTVSTAISTLAAEGLVATSQGRGAVALPPSPPRTDTLIGLCTQLPDIRAAATERHRLIIGSICDTLLRLRMPYEPVFIRSDRRFADDLKQKYTGLLFLQDLTHNDQILELDAAGVPLVIAALETDLPVNCTTVDRAATTIKAVETLIALGHRKIALTSVDTTRYFYPQAKQAFLSALALHGIEPRPEYIAEAPRSGDVLAHYFRARALLNLKDPPTAIVAGRDYQAQAVCAAAAEAGLAIGRDLSVIGYDDMTWPEGRDFLTTFREPWTDLGARAAELLLKRMASPRVHEKVALDAVFVLRRSAGPAPDADRDVLAALPPITA